MVLNKPWYISSTEKGSLSNVIGVIVKPIFKYVISTMFTKSPLLAKPRLGPVFVRVVERVFPAVGEERCGCCLGMMLLPRRLHSYDSPNTL